MSKDKATDPELAGKYTHYYRPFPYKGIDIYRFLQVFGVTDPCLQHAIKKLTVAGMRGAKDVRQDVREAIDSCKRFLEMREEEIKSAEASGFRTTDTPFPELNVEPVKAPVQAPEDVYGEQLQKQFRILFSPATGLKFQASLDAVKYRIDNPNTVWTYDPWTGYLRSPGCVENDPLGKKILPPAPMPSAPVTNVVTTNYPG